MNSQQGSESVGGRYSGLGKGTHGTTAGHKPPSIYISSLNARYPVTPTRIPNQEPNQAPKSARQNIMKATRPFSSTCSCDRRCSSLSLPLSRVDALVAGSAFFNAHVAPRSREEAEHQPSNKPPTLPIALLPLVFSIPCASTVLNIRPRCASQA